MTSSKNSESDLSNSNTSPITSVARVELPSDAKLLEHQTPLLRSVPKFVHVVGVNGRSRLPPSIETLNAQTLSSATTSPITIPTSTADPNSKVPEEKVFSVVKENDRKAKNRPRRKKGTKVKKVLKNCKEKESTPTAPPMNQKVF